MTIPYDAVMVETGHRLAQMWQGPGASISQQAHPASPHPPQGSEEPRGFSCEGAGFAQRGGPQEIPAAPPPHG